MTDGLTVGRIEQFTPGPWRLRQCSHGGMVLQRGDPGTHPQSHVQIVPEADARLIAAAPDHALFGRAIAAGVIRWERFTGSETAGEICCDGLRHATTLDEFGVPCLTVGVRAAIAKKEGR